jgi:hypothetical protein
MVLGSIARGVTLVSQEVKRKEFVSRQNPSPVLCYMGVAVVFH